MSVIEIILFVAGILLVVAGYTYSKVKDPKHGQAKIPDEYEEYFGICKKHSEKDGKPYEVFKIIKDDKTLKYEFPPKENKEELIPVDSIEKFYIKADEPETVKHASDFGKVIKKGAKLDDKSRKLSYVLMGVGLLLIIITLFITLF